MIPFHELIINIFSLIIIPFSDLVLTVSSIDNFILIFINLLNLLQSYIYTVSYYSLNQDNDDNTSNITLSLINSHFYLFYFAVFSLLIYCFSILIQLSNTMKTLISNSYNLSSTSSLESSQLKQDLSQNLPSSTLVENSIHSSMINNFAQSLSNSISNSISLSPSLTNLSRKSNDILVFKIDDILSPYSIKDQSNLQLNLKSHPTNDISNIPQFNLQNSNTLSQLNNINKKNNNYNNNKNNNTLVKSFKATPVLATLLALSATPSPSNAIPLNNLQINNIYQNGNNKIMINYYSYFNNSNLNFILSFLINLLNLGCSLNSSFINIFKSSINLVNWILISFYKYKCSNNNINTIIPLFDNKLMVFSNTLIVLLSFGITIYVVYSNFINKYYNNDHKPDNKSLNINTHQSYNSV